MSLQFIGCASHRFNLALKDVFHTEKDLIEKVLQVMKALKKHSIAAKLRLKTTLRPALHNQTRWSSTAHMFSRYLQLRQFIRDLDEDEIELPSRREDSRIDGLCAKFKDLDAVRKELQKDSTTCADVRYLFDTVIQDYPSLASRLSNKADIVKNKPFEAALVKIQNGAFSSMTAVEVAEVEALKNPTDQTTDDTTSGADNILSEVASEESWR